METGKETSCTHMHVVERMNISIPGKIKQFFCSAEIFLSDLSIVSALHSKIRPVNYGGHQ